MSENGRLDADGVQRVALALAAQHVTGVADNGPVTSGSGTAAALTALQPLTPDAIQHALTWAMDSSTAQSPQGAGLGETVPVIHPDGTVLHLSATALHGPAVQAAQVATAAEVAVLLQHITHRLWTVAALERYRLLAEQLDEITANDTEAGV